MKSLQQITEIIENESELEAVIKHRIKNIKNFSSLGPPDICYLTKQFQGSLLGNKNNEKTGFYHYVSGLDCSTAANVSAYIHSLLQKQEKDQNWIKNGGYKILKGYMCIFDSFSRNDIHVEVNIPGSMRIYGYTNENNLITVNDKLWEKAYVSSVLRSMNKQTFSYGKMFEEIKKPQQFSEFLESLFNIIMRIDIPLEKNEVNYIFEYNGSKAMSIVMKYLFQRKRYILASDLLINYVKISPKCIFFLAQLYWELKKYQDSLQIFSFYIIKYPQAVNLYYYQALQLIDIERYQEAYTIAKYLHTMVPNNFDTNMLLCTIFLKVKSYGLALVALNSASQHIRPSICQKNSYFREIKVFETENREKTSPKQTGLSDQFIDLVISPVRNVVLGIKDKSKENKDQKMLQEYENFNIKYDITQDEIQILQQFSMIAKDIGISELSNLMADIFAFEEIERQKFVQFPGVMIAELKHYEQKKIIQQEKQDEEDFGNEEECSLPGFLRDTPQKVPLDPQSIAKRKFEWSKKQNINTTTWEKQRNNQQITENADENLSSDRPNLSKITVQYEPQIKLNTELLTLQLQDQYPISKRIINNSFNNLFVSFQKIQSALSIFQQEIDQNQQEFDHSYQVYLFRAFMCDLCSNEKLAIEAYHKILQRCYCFHAWHRLMQLYQKEGNYKAIMICMAECMDELEKFGITQFSYLPEWLELSIIDIVSKKGMEFVRNLQQELKFTDSTVTDCLNKIQIWQTLVEGQEGTN